VKVHPNGSLLYVGGGFNLGTACSFNSTTGALTLIPGVTFNVGDGLEIEPTGRFLYTSEALHGTNNVFAYGINSSTGGLTAVLGSPFSAVIDAEWTALDPTGKYLYVVNPACCGGGPGVLVYAIDSISGSLTPAPGSPFSTGSGPQLITTVQVCWALNIHPLKTQITRIENMVDRLSRRTREDDVTTMKDWSSLAA
jgi:6-phosphogluconolactonase (cycloisomerase 2 family)